MCRYSMVSYKPHYACFECKKSFKRRLASDIRSIYEDQLPAKCPDCGALTADMGLDFKAPKIKDEKAWKHLRNLFQVGITFHSCGCSGPGYIPADLEALIEHLEHCRSEFIKARRYWSQSSLPEEIRRPAEMEGEGYSYTRQLPKELQTRTRRKWTVDQMAAKEFFLDKIASVENELKKLRASPSEH